MDGVKSHRDLIVWQKAMDFADRVLDHAERLPKSQAFVMGTQLMRAGISVPANIAEGNARGTAKDYAHFLSIAKGSLVEAETYLLLALRREFLLPDEVSPTLGLATEIGKMLTAIRAKLRE